MFQTIMELPGWLTKLDLILERDHGVEDMSKKPF